MGLEDVGFLTKISKDFFSLRGGWPSWPSGRGGLSWAGLDGAAGSPAGSCPRGSSALGLGELTSGPAGCCPPQRPGPPAGDAGAQPPSLPERTTTSRALRCGGAEFLSCSLCSVGRPCQLLSSLLTPAEGHTGPPAAELQAAGTPRP